MFYRHRHKHRWWDNKIRGYCLTCYFSLISMHIPTRIFTSAGYTLIIFFFFLNHFYPMVFFQLIDQSIPKNNQRLMLGLKCKDRAHRLWLSDEWWVLADVINLPAHWLTIVHALIIWLAWFEYKGIA